MESEKLFSKVKKNLKTEQNLALIPHFIPGKTKKLGERRVECSKKAFLFPHLQGRSG